MSALFTREPGSRCDEITTNRTLELRQLPFMDHLLVPDRPTSYVDQRGYRNISSTWLYSAAIQLTLNGSQPFWSRDGWSFLPVDLSELNGPLKGSSTRQGRVTSYDEDRSSYSSTNVSLTTPSIRGRVDCTPLTSQDIGKDSPWFDEIDLSNSSVWDTSRNDPYIRIGYQLRKRPWRTSLLAYSIRPRCCENRTMEGHQGKSAIGYWSIELARYNSSWPRNFTAKWIYADARTEFYASPEWDELVLTEIPKIQALNCKPVIETSTADVIVDGNTGTVHSFRILDQPVPAKSPWSDDIQDRGRMNPNDRRHNFTNRSVYRFSY